MSSKSNLVSDRLATATVSQPVRLPREAKCTSIAEMEPHERAWIETGAVVVDASDRVWIDAERPIFAKRVHGHADAQIRRVENGVELIIPNTVRFFRHMSVADYSLLPVFKFDYVEEHLLPLDI